MLNALIKNSSMLSCQLPVVCDFVTLVCQTLYVVCLTENHCMDHSCVRVNWDVIHSGFIFKDLLCMLASISFHTLEAWCDIFFCSKN